ncbi:putative late blight resistance protein homolog R1B-16 [Salvia hispanica]|uniref:putative late blight resistance protein homolog R1B-16 n=1 Tax=Salvia hispanica TaxID=49212 RepID=UPI00200985B4|nr:putative late blight resistance protein homolog R1B-16 [Salvia hispanica]
MAAYGALVSLTHIIDTLHKHPSPPISIPKPQLHSLTQNVTFLQEFLDTYISPFANSHEADPLERSIANAVYAAEDIIEAQIVVQIDKRSTSVEDDSFYTNLQKVIEEMDLITKEVQKIAVEPQQQKKPVAPLTRSYSTENVMVGSEQVFLEVLDELTRDQLNRQIIPITGMGGIGKTTLAKSLFENGLVKESFDIRAWTTISQTYNFRETLRQVYIQASGDENLTHLDDNQLGEKLYKFLYGRRYLVIMDDMWSVDVWEKIKIFFPDCENGSRIIITTRMSNLSAQLNESHRVDMEFLDEASSWDLFSKIVFGKESCPIEFENIGKNIVANCKGLPLSIVTIGGLLAKSEHTRAYWERVDQNLNSIVNSSNDDLCLRILRMSYIYLPNYLKPSFLYLSIFEEDCSIRVSTLERLWVSEGFLKPRSGKCLETIAQEYFKELVDRNLILVDELGSIGNVTYCKIHDLLRDMCLKEAEKEGFHYVIRDDPPSNNSERRVVFPPKASKLLKSEVLGSFSHARSIISDCHIKDDCDVEVRLPHTLRLLRILKALNEDTVSGAYFLENVFELVNSRYLAIGVLKPKFPSSIELLWNLHTLIIYCEDYLIVPTEIWKMHPLRHLEFKEAEVILPVPPRGGNNVVIMENLQTLKGVKNLILDEEVVKRIPNVKVLHISYHGKQMEEEKCLRYLQCLSKLENLRCSTEDGSGEWWQWIRFPHSLKKLTVNASDDEELEGLLEKVGSLPLLEKFVLRNGFFKTGMWETIEGQFPSLKFLTLANCDGLEDWIVTHNSLFPLLQQLHLSSLYELKEIPSQVGDIAMLKSIYLRFCSMNKSLMVSAKKIVEEREDSYGDQLDLHVVDDVRNIEETQI